MAGVSGRSGADCAAIAYGTKNGLDTAKRQIVSQAKARIPATAGIPGTAETSDHFGDRLTTTSPPATWTATATRTSWSACTASGSAPRTRPAR
ncbi:hypothetical protein ABZX40_27770 [Streptomyces sp. NPDC004610]|uniref:hypothetical protein n=1 Tax=unclassified Streptomyces TaxID=2593676 RepID=UPI0033A87C50